jgi:NAD(P)-dependent dehydrogenase (short-subunit alcohol dehydrogenase family)
VRDLAAGGRVAAELAGLPGGPVAVAPLELADLESVRAFVAAWDGPLHVLVNNAGVMACPEQHVAAGWDLQFATNHLGHFALATGLHAALAAAGDARVVSVSSLAHHRSPVVFDDIAFAHRPYEPWSAYGQSKTANALFAVEAGRRWAADGILVNSLHPGSINTALQRHVDPAEIEAMRAAIPGDIAWKSAEAGAATSVLCAASPLVAGVTGRYFEDCHEAEPTEGGARWGVMAHALDPEAAAQLWELSERAVA